MNRPIFGLRFRSNAELNPTQEDLSAFLASMKRTGRRELHGKDLVRYGHMLEDLAAFELRQEEDAQPADLRDKMFYGVLAHSQFINPALKLAVEQYKYHLQTLSTLDFNKPTVFIASAEKEISRFNPKKKDDAARIARFRGMIEERKRKLDALEKARTALVEELGSIAQYIRDGLVKIKQLCEKSIVILVELHISRNEEIRLIEEIRDQFKERLRDSLHQGQIRKQDLETAKQEVTDLSRELSEQLREDIYSLTGLYEAIHGHTNEIISDLDACLAEARKKNRAIDDDRELFAKIESVLSTLVSKYHFKLKTHAPRDGTAYEKVLLEKRTEMVDRVLELLRQERRSLWDRRTGEDRRRSKDPRYKGSERRTGKERRSGKNRRA